MEEIDQTRRDMLVQVAQMYYVEGLSQEEIAKKIHLSRSNISRMLKACLEKKLLKSELIILLPWEYTCRTK